ncbi:hypothetical protein ACW73L_18325 [Methylolobus aquaticus]
MKTNQPFKSTAMVVLFLVVMVPIDNVLAEFSLPGHLGPKKRATDMWKITCDSDTNHLNLYVTDYGPKQSPKLNAQLFKGNRANSATDPVAKDGEDLGHSSPAINLRGGPGEYYVLLDKSGLGKKDYGVWVHCMTRDGLNALTVGVDLIQDQ